MGPQQVLENGSWKSGSRNNVDQVLKFKNGILEPNNFCKIVSCLLEKWGKNRLLHLMWNPTNFIKIQVAMFIHMYIHIIRNFQNPKI